MTLTRTTSKGNICQDLALNSTNSRRSLENDLGQELTMNSSERLNSMEIRSGRLNSMEIRRNFNDDFSVNDCRMVRRAKLRRLLKKNKDIFREELSKALLSGRAVDHVIETDDASPVNRHAYPLLV